MDIQKTTANLIANLIARAIYSNTYRIGPDLSNAIYIINDNNPEELISLYLKTRRDSTSSIKKSNYSRISGLKILKFIVGSDKLFKLLIDNLKNINIRDICVEELDIIIRNVFEKQPEYKHCLIEFVSNDYFKSKIKYSELSNEIKEELNSYQIINKIVN